MDKSEKSVELPIPRILKRLTEAGHGDLCEQVARAQSLPSLRGATEAYEALIECCDRRLQTETTLRPEYRSVLALATFNLGRLLSAQGQFVEAVPLARRSVTLCGQLIQEGYSDLRPFLPSAENELGFALVSLGQKEEATDLFMQASARWQELISEGNACWRGELGRTHMNHGLALNMLGQRDAAIATLRQAISLHEQLVEGDGGARHELAKSRANLGAILHAHGRQHEATAELQEAWAIYERLLIEGREDLLPEAARIRNFLEDVLGQPPLRTKTAPNPLEGLNNGQIIDLLQDLPAELQQEMMLFFSGQQTPLAAVALAQMGLMLASREPNRLPQAIEYCQGVLGQIEALLPAGESSLRFHLTDLRRRFNQAVESQGK
jgi:tetratricopeptide (TPR) repeat protein